ncbi:MAG: hypothetical protein ACLVB1_02870 [Blautia obeum]
MAKSCNQKEKILYLQKMLSETTSQKPVTMQEILATWKNRDLELSERVFMMIWKTLRDFGMDIHYRRGRKEDIMRKICFR